MMSNMRNTRDMFGSDYFTNKPDLNENEEFPQRKGSLLRKDTNGSSCVKVKRNIELNCSRLSE